MPRSRWKALVAKYQEPCARRASWQLINSIGSYLLMWVLIYFCAPISWWLAVPPILVAAGLLTRIFIIFHDCGHGSFFKSRSANDFWGYTTGILLAVPYHQWRWRHSLHHGHAGNLDRRGVGDVDTMTVNEFLAATPWQRLVYRLTRNPILLFVIGPLFYFLVYQRFPSKRANNRERLSVWCTNLGLLCSSIALINIFGLIPYLIIQLSIMAISGAAGVWLFYVQHQFEEVYWERNTNWDWTSAALEGSSFYKLPRILQWFSGNIGFHHVHHLSSRIPNYNLEECHASDPMFQQSPTLTLRDSLKSLNLRLWDESSRKLVGYKHLRTLRAQNKLRHAG